MNVLPEYPNNCLAVSLRVPPEDLGKDDLKDIFRENCSIFLKENLTSNENQITVYKLKLEKMDIPDYYQLIVNRFKKASSCFLKSSDLSKELANQLSDKGNPIDPVSGKEISAKWMQGPRFLMIGKYLFSLDTLLKTIFLKALVFDSEANQFHIQHPIENRIFTNDEQSKFITDFSRLFIIEKNKILELWQPFRDDPQVKEVEESDLLEKCLFKMVPNWEQFTQDIRFKITNYIKQPFFASLRLRLFLKSLPKNILNLKIENNSSDSFCLKDLYQKEVNRVYDLSPVL